MVKGGLIIRLIDVVLIILLGFLTISDFSLKTQIKLDLSGDESKREREKVIITVRILPNKNFYIKESDQDERLLQRAKTLETYLSNRSKDCKQKKAPLMVVIEPHLDTEMQVTVDVLNICEKLQINKTISYPNLIL